MRLNANKSEDRLTATLGEWIQSGMAAGSKRKLPDSRQLPLMAAHLRRPFKSEGEALAEVDDIAW